MVNIYNSATPFYLSVCEYGNLLMKMDNKAGGGEVKQHPHNQPTSISHFYPTIWNIEKLLPGIPTFPFFFGKLEEGMQESKWTNRLQTWCHKPITANKARIQNSLQIKSQNSRRQSIKQIEEWGMSFQWNCYLRSSISVLIDLLGWSIRRNSSLCK